MGLVTSAAAGTSGSARRRCADGQEACVGELLDDRAVRGVVVGRDDYGIDPGGDGAGAGALVGHGPADRDLGRVADGQARRGHVGGRQVGIRGQGRDLRSRLAELLLSAVLAPPGPAVLYSKTWL